jgi:TonB family protein
METLLYLAKVNAYWLLFYACYWLLLRRHTFFHWNRVYLLGTLLIAFVLPAIRIAEPVTTIHVPETVYQKATISVAVVAGNTPEQGESIWLWVAGIYLIVVSALIWKFFTGLREVFKAARRSERIDMGTYTLLLLPGNAQRSSFSFFRRLFLSAYDYRHNPDAVIRHEYEHIRQWHTIDILVIELVKICFWFNPALWLYKRSIQTIHEYLADLPVPNRNDYASFLLAYAMRSPDIAIANHFFNSSILKNRIYMIYKKRSSRWLLAKYLLILPVATCSVAITASRAPLQAIEKLKTDVEQTLTARGRILDESNAPIEDAFIIISGTTRGTSTDANGRFELQNVPVNSKLAISHVAYEAFEVTVTDDGTVAFDVIMKKAANKITGPVVVGRPALSNNGGAANSNQVSGSTYMQVVEQQPEFPGGKDALMSYLLGNLKYPENARRQNVEAIALVTFSVDKNGEIRNARNLKEIGYGIDGEALRVVNEMPRWIPGVQNGKTVEVEYTLEINFKLEKNKEDKRQGFMNFGTKSIFSAPNADEIDSFLNGTLNLSASGRVPGIAIGGSWGAIPKTLSTNAPSDVQTGNYRYFKYGGTYLQHRTPVFKNVQMKYQKPDSN